MQRDEVVRRLVAAGLYDANRGRPLAAAPLRVGVVTSTSGAAWADFVHELERSSLGFQVRVIDARVQGDQAVDMVTRAIRTLGRQRDLDVVTVIRGGGARSELATFDHEAIAMAIATCPLPVLTGLGHEIDRSVADEVAHASLKTPTACAAALVERVLAFRQRSEVAWSGVCRVAERQRRPLVQPVDRGGPRRAPPGRSLPSSASRRAAAQRAGRAGAAGKQVLDRADRRLEAVTASMARAPGRLDGETRHLDAVAERVRLLDPVHTMARGWSITRTTDGRVVRAAGRAGGRRRGGHHLRRRLGAQRRARGHPVSPKTTGSSEPVEPVATGYAAALAELETILQSLERTDVDVDVLATQVARAAELIAFCRDRIGNARLQIEQVVASLDAGRDD